MLRKIMKKLGYQKVGTGKRGFKGAVSNSLTNDWAFSPIQINNELRKSGEKLRARSRDMALNNPVFKRYLDMRVRNIVGNHGIKLQMKVREQDGSADDNANRIIESAWMQWGEKGVCTVDGKMTWQGVQEQHERLIGTDGEAIILKHPNWDNEYNFAIQILDSCSLDYNYNDTLRNGNVVCMGIEFDQYMKPIAYHFRENKTKDYQYNYCVTNAYGQHKRVPAEYVIHSFTPEFANQLRGFPKVAQSMYNMNMLEGYNEALLVNARTSACRAGYFEQTAGSDYNPDDVDSQGFLYDEMSPGVNKLLPEGIKYSPNNPNQPTSQHEIFIKTQLREIANGLGVNYNLLANDLEGVNYNSLRAGSLDERDGWRQEQRHTIENLCKPVFNAWLDSYLLSAISPLPYSKKWKFKADTWLPRSFPWVDPKKDAEAKIMMIDNNLEAPQTVVSELGQDLVDVYDMIARANEMQAEAGIVDNENSVNEE